MDQDKLPDGVPAKFFDHGAYGLSEAAVTELSQTEIENTKRYLIKTTVLFLVLGVLYLVFLLILTSIGVIDLSASGMMTPAEFRANWLTFPAIIMSVVSLGGAVVIVGVGLFIGGVLLKRIYDWMRFVLLIV